MHNIRVYTGVFKFHVSVLLLSFLLENVANLLFINLIRNRVLLYVLSRLTQFPSRFVCLNPLKNV